MTTTDLTFLFLFLPLSLAVCRGGGKTTKVYFADGEFAFLCMRFARSFFVAAVFACHYSFDWMVDKFIPRTERSVDGLSDNWDCI